MAFNLNKGEQPIKKNSFDLSKGDAATDVTPPEKTGNWIRFLIAFLVICGLACYFIRQNVPAELTAVSKPVPVAAQADTGPPVRQMEDNGLTVVKDTSNTKTKPLPSTVPLANQAEPTLVASFSSGSAIPLRIANRALAQIRKKAKSGRMVMVFGYASSEGDLTFNQAIAQARADAYKKHLIQNGVARARITAKGKGIENPIASNGTEAGRQKNRRVEVIFQ